MSMTLFEGEASAGIVTICVLMSYRTNLTAHFVNCQVSSTTRYAQMHPMSGSDSSFPPHFKTPRTVEEIRTVDCGSI
ncbi:hypothetical protein BS50DRAFT_573630 [Corynespora cassiicola Philippines]|uniref:Uncharacterized protein n=1 Tax=Corynespora cassiicola Philippines TaxID=1448308 RepID=A0A2T2NN71_CORCC|nr:hypothetical protein BS50DRAFT_573630 [Corynespora cassiicola Philippines]